MSTPGPRISLPGRHRVVIPKFFQDRYHAPERPNHGTLCHCDGPRESGRIIDDSARGRGSEKSALCPTRSHISADVYSLNTDSQLHAGFDKFFFSGLTESGGRLILRSTVDQSLVVL